MCVLRAPHALRQEQKRSSNDSNSRTAVCSVPLSLTRSLFLSSLCLYAYMCLEIKTSFSLSPIFFSHFRCLSRSLYLFLNAW